MRKSIVILAVALMAVTVAFADQIQVGYPGQPLGPYTGGNGGGEFTFLPINPAGWLNLSNYDAGVTRDVGVSGSFQTFCIEGNEGIYGYDEINIDVDKSWPYDATLSQNAMQGSMGPSGDPVSVGTGWLYSQFARGVLSGYTYGPSVGARQTSAGLLQQAIWWLEGEKSVVYSAANPFMAAVVNHFGSEALAQADGGWNYGVYALNLTKTTQTGTVKRIQDGLVYVPDGGMTLILLGIAFAATAFAYSRIRV
jgi:hypothetical protein